MNSIPASEPHCHLLNRVQLQSHMLCVGGTDLKHEVVDAANDHRARVVVDLKGFVGVIGMV